MIASLLKCGSQSQSGLDLYGDTIFSSISPAPSRKFVAPFMDGTHRIATSLHLINQTATDPLGYGGGGVRLGSDEPPSVLSRIGYTHLNGPDFPANAHHRPYCHVVLEYRAPWVHSLVCSNAEHRQKMKKLVPRSCTMVKKKALQLEGALFSPRHCRQFGSSTLTQGTSATGCR